MHQLSQEAEKENAKRRIDYDNSAASRMTMPPKSNVGGLLMTPVKKVKKEFVMHNFMIFTKMRRAEMKSQGVMDQIEKQQVAAGV